jgi:hypothetical protein
MHGYCYSRLSCSSALLPHGWMPQRPPRAAAGRCCSWASVLLLSCGMAMLWLPPDPPDPASPGPATPLRWTAPCCAGQLMPMPPALLQSSTTCSGKHHLPQPGCISCATCHSAGQQLQLHTSRLAAAHASVACHMRHNGCQQGGRRSVTRSCNASCCCCSTQQHWMNLHLHLHLYCDLRLRPAVVPALFATRAWLV